MTIYKKIIVSSINCTSIEISDEDAEKLEDEEMTLEEAWDSAVEETQEKFCYDKEFDVDVDYDTSER